MRGGHDGGGTGPFAFLARRRFLRLGLVAGGALLGGLGGGFLWLRGTAPHVEGLRVLDDHEHRTLASLVEVLFPPSGGFPVDVPAMDLPRAFDRFLEGEPEENVSALHQAITLLELGPFVFDRRLTSFSRLSLPDRERHFHAWMESDEAVRRQVSLAFRKFFHLVFFDREEVWPHLGYPGPSLAAHDRERER